MTTYHEQAKYGHYGAKELEDQLSSRAVSMRVMSVTGHSPAACCSSEPMHYQTLMTAERVVSDAA